jgi:hypothetical protein
MLNFQNPASKKLAGNLFVTERTVFGNVRTLNILKTIKSIEMKTSNPRCSHQWFEMGGGVTNSIAAATSTSQTTNALILNGTSFLIVAGNDSSGITTSVAALIRFDWRQPLCAVQELNRKPT